MTNNKELTAVEWFGMEMGKLFAQYHGKIICIGEFHKKRFELEEQAKEMEKEQHGKTWDKSMDNLDSRGGNMVRAWVDFDEHYNETYGGGKQ